MITNNSLPWDASDAVAQARRARRACRGSTERLFTDDAREQRAQSGRSTRHTALAECPRSASHCFRAAKSGMAR